MPVAAIEISFNTPPHFTNPRLDLNPLVKWIGPNAEIIVVPAFYHKAHEWRARLFPTSIGHWHYSVHNHAVTGNSIAEGMVEVSVLNPKGHLRARPHEPWYFAYEDGSVPFLLGDTLYNLVAACYSGKNIESLLIKRKAQGFNLIRVRATVSPYHPHTPYSDWMHPDGWMWMGSPQCPDYSQFNPRYLESIDRVLDLCSKLEILVELIAESWLMEAPFNQRDRFLPEHEELLVRELVARFGSHPALAMWCVANEYNLYVKPASDPLNDWYARRLARLFRHYDGHRKLIATHVTAAESLAHTFRDRFRNVEDIDVLLMQYWGQIDTIENAALCLGMEAELHRSLLGADQAIMLAEYGYETAPDSANPFPGQERLGPSHNRRGALRALFLGIPIITGFENTWGPVYLPDSDPVGIQCFRHIRKLFTEWVDFTAFKPAPIDFSFDQAQVGAAPLMMTNNAGQRLIYLPMGGTICWNPALPPSDRYWFNPRDGAVTTAIAHNNDPAGCYTSPGELDEAGNSTDWVFIS